MRKLYFLLFLIVYSIQAFSQNYTVLGSASQLSSCNYYQLTPNSGDQAGAIFQNKTINLNNSFDFTFSNFFGCNGASGADGEAFVLTSNPNGLGNQGEGLGYGGSNQPCSFAIEFDTWQNSDHGDPSYDHTAYESGGSVNHNVSGPVAALPSQSNLDNCQWHTIRIVWNVNTQTMDDYVDGNLRISMVIPNLVGTYLCNNPIVNWGWTGSTGGGWNLQQVKIVTISSWVAGTNYESCSPTVQFTDVSTSQIGPLNTWSWTFGDGTTSTQQNPLHTYPGTGTYNASLIVTDASGCPDTFAHAVVIKAPITLTPTVTPPLCNGAQTGSIFVDTAGGFGSAAGHGGFSFNWSNGSQQQTDLGLGAGTYTVTVTDGVCSATGQYTINQPTAVSASTSATAANCGVPNGTCTITITGGTPPYRGTPPAGVNFAGIAATGGPNTFTASGFLGGTYIADFQDANGCSALLQYTATVPTLPCGISSNATSTNVTCFGGNNGSATLTVTGAGVAPPATITWTKAGTNVGTGVTISNLTAGTYTYSYTDQTPGNPFTGTVVISQPSSAITVTLATSNISCAGNNNGQAIASVGSGGTAPFTYAWSVAGQGNNPVASNLGTGGITVTVTDATNVCSATATGTIASAPLLVLPPPTVTSNACNAGNNGSATANPTGGTPYTAGGTPSYQYYWSNISSAKTDLSLSGGTYTVTVTDSLGCSATGSAVISEATAFTNSIDSTNIKCYGDSTGTITVNSAGGTTPYSYNWSSDSTGTFNPNLVGGSLTTLKAGEYLLTVTDAHGCTFMDSTFLQQPAAPLTIDTSHGNVTCFGANNGFIAITIHGGTAPYTYQGNPIPAGPDTLANLAPAAYTGIIMDANQCSVTNSIMVTQPLPDSLVLTQTNDLCFGTSIGTATANFVNPNGAVIYNWSNNQSGTTISGLAANIYSVTATDANSCSFTGSVTISQPPAITLQVPVTNILCYGQVNGAITVNATGGTGAPYTYTWSPNVSTTNTASGLASGPYIISVTDGNNCVKDTLINITAPQAPLSAIYTVNNVPCFGTSTGSILASTSGGTPPYTYTWPPAAPSPDSASLNLAAGGPYNVTITDANGCTIDSFFTLTQPQAALTITTSQTNLSCYQSNDGSATVIPAGGTTPYKYAWTPFEGSNATATSLGAATYTVTVTDTNQCTATAQIIVTQPAQILADSVIVNILCNGAATGSITLNTTGGVPGAGYSYNWNPASSITNAATNLAAGTYNVTITDATNCSITRTISLSQPTAVTINPSTTAVSCFGDVNGTLTAIASGGTGSTYNYLISNGSNITLSNTTGQFNNLPSSNYTVVAVDQNNCADTIPVVVVHPNPITDQISTANQSCSYLTNGQFDVQALGGNGGYQFSSPGLTTNTSGVFTGLAPGTYYLTITDSKGCTLADSAVLAAADTVLLSVVPVNGQVKLGDSLQLNSINNQPGNVTYLWTPNIGLSCYDCADPVFNGIYSEPYTVQVTNDSGCVSTFNFTVTVIPDYQFFIPNVFTPNGDGKNDTWQIYGSTATIKQLQIMVFDRWGEKVFQSYDVNFVWDGIYKGQYVPHGVYVYALKIVWLDNHSDDTVKGSLTILR